MIDVLIRRLQANLTPPDLNPSRARMRSRPRRRRLRSCRAPRPGHLPMDRWPCHTSALVLCATVPPSMSTFTRWALLAALPSRCWRSTPRPTRRRSAPSPSIRPTKGTSSAGTCRRTNIDFVELVERGRPDWLAVGLPQRCPLRRSSSFPAISTAAPSSTRTGWMRANFCRSTRWSAPRAVTSCPGLFSQLKEVYLFGCNTLNAEAMRSASAEIARSLVRSGHSPADAERLSRRPERAARRKQSRSHAADLQGRAGDLRLFLEGAAGAQRRARSSTAIFNRAPAARSAAAARAPSCSSLFAPSSMTVGGRVERFGSGRGIPARRLPFFRRSPVAGAEARASSMSCWGARWPKYACSSTTSRNILRSLDERERASAVGRAGARRDRARRAARDAISRLRARRRPAGGSRAHAGAGATCWAGCRRPINAPSSCE